MAALGFTFGSIGDIISFCNVVHEAVRAISNTHGSKNQYRSLGKEIWNLSRALVSVKSLAEQHKSDIQRKGDLEKAVSDCHDCLIRFLNRIKGFENLGRQNDRINSVMSVKILAKKLKWPTYNSECEAFRKEIASHTSSILIILACASLSSQCVSSRLAHESLEQSSQDLGQQLVKCESRQLEHYTSLIDAISREAQTRYLRQDELQTTSRDLIQGSSERIIKVLNSNHNECRNWFDQLQPAIPPQHEGEPDLILVTHGLCQDGIRLLHYLLAIIRGLLKLGHFGLLIVAQAVEQTILSNQLPALVVRKSVMFFEDALLDRFEIDTAFTSYRSFIQDLHDRFDSTDGQQIVRNEDYWFEDRIGCLFDVEDAWKRQVLAGKRIFMRVIVAHTQILNVSCSTCDRVYEEINKSSRYTCPECSIDCTYGGRESFSGASQIGSVPFSPMNPRLRSIEQSIGFFKRVHYKRVLALTDGQEKWPHNDYHRPRTLLLHEPIQHPENHNCISEGRINISNHHNHREEHLSKIARSWYCGECGHGPLTMAVDEHCLNCGRLKNPIEQR